jgi:hypothetical protein
MPCHFFARDDQALNDADVLGAEFGPVEEPGFSAHRYDTRRSFRLVGVDRYIRIGEEEFESDTALAPIVQRLTVIKGLVGVKPWRSSCRSTIAIRYTTLRRTPVQ